MDWKPTYKTPPGRNIASTSHISFPKLGRIIFENASTFTLGSIIIIIIIIIPPIPTHWFFKCLLSIPLGCSHLWCALFFQPATTWRFPLRSPHLQVLGDTTAIGFCQPNAALAIPLLAGQNLPGLEKMRGLKFNPPRLNLITMNLTILCPLFPDFCHNDRTGRNKSAGSCCH